MLVVAFIKKIGSAGIGMPASWRAAEVEPDRDDFRDRPTQGPIRGVPGTSGKVAASSRRRRSRDAGARARRHREPPRQVADLAVATSIPGFSWPAGP
jgi:hypothetical protein